LIDDPAAAAAVAAAAAAIQLDSIPQCILSVFSSVSIGLHAVRISDGMSFLPSFPWSSLNVRIA
jgi:hypothetical protein